MIYYCCDFISQELVDSMGVNEVHVSEVTAITGAGISVSSGLPTGSGEVSNVELTKFFRSELWIQTPDQAFCAYREMLRDWRQAKPNAAHYALAEAGVKVITQNIDGLHRDAGRTPLIEIHGNLWELLCRDCGALFPSDFIEHARSQREGVPFCPTCQSMLLPGVVLEGEEVRHIARATEWVLASKLVLIVGTELNMEPIRALREACMESSCDVVWISSNAESWVPTIIHRLEC